MLANRHSQVDGKHHHRDARGRRGVHEEVEITSAATGRDGIHFVPRRKKRKPTTLEGYGNRLYVWGTTTKG